MIVVESMKWMLSDLMCCDKANKSKQEGLINKDQTNKNSEFRVNGVINYYIIRVVIHFMASSRFHASLKSPALELQNH